MKILFLDGTKGFDPFRLAAKPAGGIISSLTLIPQYLADRGHDVTVVSIWEEEASVNSVRYTRLVSTIPEPDVVVFNRNVISRGLINRFKSAVKVWWLHDIVDYRYLEDDGFKDVDCIVALSAYCMDSYSDFYDIPAEKFVIIPNGVDSQIFYEGEQRRDKNLYICASAPVKGFYPIWYVVHNMKRLNPLFQLRMYCSQSLHDYEDDPKVLRALESLKTDGVEICEPIPQQELADLMRQAWCLLMPNHYPEICSNLLLQAQGCGLPVVASNIGSASEFIFHKRTGLLTKTAPSDMFWWWKDFTVNAMKLYRDEGLHRHISKHAPENVSSWKQIGARWNDLLEDLCRESTQNTRQTISLAT